MKPFYKQLIFILAGIAVITTSVLIVKSATPSGKIAINPSATTNLKVNPILGHDLDLDAKYYAQAANNTIHDITTEDISISAWVKADTDATSIRYILAKRGGSPYLSGYKFYISSNGGLIGYFVDAAGDNYLVGSGINIKDNKWHHVGLVYDKDTSGNCKVYLDGINITATRIANGVVDSLTASGNMMIGHSDAAWDGQIRDVKLYYAAGDHWTDEQILYQAQHPFDYSASAGTLTDYWRCDEGTGTTVGGYANDLTLSNALAWSTQPVVKMTTGLVGWWKMDDNADNTSVRDYSRYGNTGTFSDATGNPFTSAHTTAGQIGSAMTFDGVDDYVSVGDPVSGSLDMASNFTITAWVKMSDPASNFDAIINKHSNAGNPSTHGTGYLITSHSTANGGVRAYLRDGTNASTIDGPSGYDIRDGNWHFVVLRADKSGNGIVYVDGVAGTLVSLITIGNLSNVTNFIIGWTITTYYFPGLIDDVRIYNYARSAEQIKQDYERGLRGRE